MNPRIWSQLQYHVDLNLIYAKLPFREFFQLRRVCKEWNRLASDQEFLQQSFKDPIPKPYFILDSPTQGLLTYEAPSNRWTWTRLPSRCGQFGNAGLVYTFHSDPYEHTIYDSEGFERDIYNPETFEQEVFNVHTRAFSKLPSPLERTSLVPNVGMVVDTSDRPYSFQIVLASGDTHTQIFNSKTNSWTQKLSEGSNTYPIGPRSFAHVNGVVYIRSQPDYEADTFDIDYYNLEKDEWGEISNPDISEYDEYVRDIGSWQGCLFVVTVECGEGTITVWELAEHPKEGEVLTNWVVYDRVPEDLYSWLTYANDDFGSESVEPQIYNKFCEEHLLVYTLLCCRWPDSRAERFVMCNLATKAWERIQVPFDELRPSKAGVEH